MYCAKNYLEENRIDLRRLYLQDGLENGNCDA
jgi:hypothetical protein